MTAKRGIPTTYKGVRFRSRLEARWAAFFDLLDWPWVYEPFDLEGYIPDFLLRFETPILVEVKPELALPPLVVHVDRIATISGWDGDIVGVGVALFADDAHPLTLGVVTQIGGPDRSAVGTADRAVFFECISCGKKSFRHDSLGWRCHVCGCDDDGGGHVGSANEEEILELWAQAGNRVQWRAA